jgi:hypothetical protein
VKGWTILVAALATATACRSIPPAAIPLAPDDPRPAALLSAWGRSAEERQGLRGRAKLSVDGARSGVHVRGKQVLVLERPARLRVEILGLLNQTLAVLVIDGERFELFRVDDRSFETGEVHPDLLWQQAHIALTPDEAVELLLGAPQADPSLVPVVALGSADGSIRIDLADADGSVRRRMGFDAEGRLRWTEVVRNDEIEWRATFDRYELVGDTPFAHAISLDVAAGNTHAEISLRDVELNPQLSPEIFRLQLPPLGESGAGEGG